MRHAGMLAYTATEIALGAHVAPAQPAPQHRLLPRDLACWNPRDCLVAVLEEPAQAAQAALALRAAGFGEPDICPASPHQIRAVVEAGERRSRPARIVAALRTLGDEGLVAAEYAEAARRGHHLLIVYTPGDGRLRRAQDVLTRHGAHTMYHFGRWIVRGL